MAKRWSVSKVRRWREEGGVKRKKQRKDVNVLGRREEKRDLGLDEGKTHVQKRSMRCVLTMVQC